ncbi:hypothetical protein P7C71_g1624, partial [Lecanoromycetidae sp. Uapishka_2]
MASSPTRSPVTEKSDSRPPHRSETGKKVSTSTMDGSTSEREQLKDIETRRFSFVSSISDRYGSIGDTKSQRSQHSRHHTAVSPLERRISAPLAVADSLGFNGDAPVMSSTRALESPRESNATTTTADSVVSDGTRTNYHTVLREVDGVTEPADAWPRPSPPGSSTSKNEIHELPAPSFVPPRISSKVTPSLEQPMDESLATTSSRAPKLSRVPFLSKLFKSAPKDESASSMMEYHRDEKPPPPPPKPYFEEESDDAESIHIAEATQARVGTPMLVKHGSAAKVGLKEMLRSPPPADNRPGTSRSRQKAAAILGEDSSLIAESLNGENFGMPKAPQDEDLAQDNGSTKSGPIGLGLWKEINPFAPSTAAPRSQSLQVPPQSSNMAASAPPVTRKVSFPLPNPLDIRPEHRFLRQSIVSTPYPSADSKESKRKKKGPTWKGSPKGVAPEANDGKAPVLTLVLYGHNNPYPQVKTLAIPSEQDTNLMDKSEDGKPPIMATLKNQFDDEKLFKLIRSEYAGMRGSFHQLVSARNVRSINLLSYHSESQLASRKAESMQFRSDTVQEEIAELRMLNLLREPRLGRDRREWTRWVNTLPQNIKDSETEQDNIALELVEGWSPGKLYVAVAAVLVCSLLATLLWILIGVGGNGVEVGDMRTDSYVKEVTRSHKQNDRDHAGLADGTADDAQHLPRYFAKSGHIDADPKKVKKEGGGKGNWGTPGDESRDYGYNFTNARRRSNSSSHSTAIGDFKTKFETTEPDPVFEEEYHGAAKDDGALDEHLALEKGESADSISTASIEEEKA